MKDLAPSAILLAAFCVMWFQLDAKIERVETKLENRIERVETLMEENLKALTTRVDQLASAYRQIENRYSRHSHPPRGRR